MTLSRRQFVGRSLAATSMLAGGRLLPAPSPAVARTVPRATVGALPSAGAILDDFQRMVDFGPRLTGTPAHERFIDWVQDELERAGCHMYPRDDKPFTYWNAERWGLELLDGDAAGPVRVSSYFPRSGETPPGGISAKLVSALRVDKIAGNIVLVDPQLPLPLTEGLFTAMASDYHWPGHTANPLRDYKRVWLATLGPDAVVESFRALGAAGVVLVLDASEAAAAGAYVPFNTGFVDCPALWVDRETGARLQRAAASTPTARLTLQAEKRRTTSPSLVGVIPGTSDEVMILNTHTDGQNAFEENAAVTLVHLARHIRALPPELRPKRSIVFSAVTGHMTAELPQTEGFVADHPDLVSAAAAGLTIEHLGATEWVDDERGFRATGEPEMCGLWTSLSGARAPLARSLREDDIPHTYVLRPVPLYLGIGEALWKAGVPGGSFIAGPTHLVNIVPNGHIDKLDAELAARQTRWIANVLTTFDGMSAAALMAGDTQLTRPKLGRHLPFPPPPVRTCLPAGTRLGSRGTGPARLGRTARELRGAEVAPRTTRRGVFRWCVEEARGQITAIVDGDRVRVVTSTLPGDRGALSRFPRRRRIGTRLFRTPPTGRTVIGTRGGRVRFLARADRATLRAPGRLRRLLRRAGL